MNRYADCPPILRDFLTYHETIKGQSPRTISEYHLDLRMFLRFIRLMRNNMPIHTRLDDIDIRDVDLDFIRSTFCPTWPMTGRQTQMPRSRTMASPLPPEPESFRQLNRFTNI